jgi:hypothetical protein
MAETRRASSASPPSPAAIRRRPAPRARLPHPRYDPPIPLDPAETPRPAAEETPTPSPAAAAGRSAVFAADTLPPTEPQAFPRSPRRALPPGDRKVLAVLLAGLALNALALLGSAPLSRADLGLGITVFLAGITLLVVQEVYRRQRR